VEKRGEPEERGEGGRVEVPSAKRTEGNFGMAENISK